MKLTSIRQLCGGVASIVIAHAAIVLPSPAKAIDGTNAAHGNEVMRVGGGTSQPIGHYDYCQRQVRDCRLIAFSIKPTRLTRQRWNELIEVNEEANSLIRPVTDMEFYGVEEHWTLPDAEKIDLAGDCEDYVLVKRKALMNRGWPASSLLPTVVRQANGDGHAVLTVRTDRGDFILDNLEDHIVTWNETEYAYLKRVSAAHSGQWETIIDSRTLVGSID